MRLGVWGALKLSQRLRVEPGRQTGFGVFSAKNNASGIKYLIMTKITTLKNDFS